MVLSRAALPFSGEHNFYGRCHGISLDAGRSKVAALMLLAMMSAGLAGTVSCAKVAPGRTSIEIISHGQLLPGELDAEGNPRLETQTSCIPLVPGTSFGVQFHALKAGMPTGNDQVTVRMTWHYPPESNRPPIEQGWTVPLGSKTTALYSLEHDWELIPGEWRIEFSDGSRKLAEQVFELHDPGKACEERG